MHLVTQPNTVQSQAKEATFCNELFRQMEACRILPEMIEIEITEQAKLTDSLLIINNLQCIKAKRIAIDDFGTGFSMIQYLTDFPKLTALSSKKSVRTPSPKPC